MKILTLFFTILLMSVTPGAYSQNRTIEAIRYGTIPAFPVSGLVAGTGDGERVDIPLMFWLIRGGDRTILLDTGFQRSKWIERFNVGDYLRPDKALQLTGVQPTEVSDVILSHLHWDHAGGVDLFPNATVWIQKDEFAYYTGPAWQDGGRHGGIDEEDLYGLLRLNTQGKLRLIEGDDQEIFPGIRVFTGGRHTFASQFVLVEGEPNFVLASDNCYLYRNLEARAPIGTTFQRSDGPSNLRALDRMVTLAGAKERVVPGHDALIFERFPASGRIARIQ